MIFGPAAAWPDEMTKMIYGGCGLAAAVSAPASADTHTLNRVSGRTWRLRLRPTNGITDTQVP